MQTQRLREGRQLTRATSEGDSCHQSYPSVITTKSSSPTKALSVFHSKKTPVFPVLEVKNEKAKSNISTNLILQCCWKVKRYSSLILHMVSVGASFLGDVGASITVMHYFSLFLLSSAPPQTSKAASLTVAMDRDEVAYVLLKWGLSVFFHSLSWSLKGSVSLHLLLVFLPHCAFGISLIPFVSLQAYLSVLRAPFSIVSVYFPLCKHSL